LDSTIDLMSLYRMLKRRFGIVVLVLAAALAASAIYSFVLAVPQYSANAVLFVWQNRTDASAGQDVTYSDIMLYDKLVSDYRELCQSRTVTSEVAERLGLGPESAEALAGKINVTTRNNTRFIQIVVTDEDPEYAAQVANTVAKVFQGVAVEKMGADNVQIIDEALPPDKPSAPNKSMNLLVALVAGLVGGIGLALLVDSLDNSVKSLEEVETLTGYTVLGTIPEMDDLPESGHA